MSFDTTGVLGTPDKPTTLHDPQARLDYQWELDDVLDAGDDLATVTWEVFLGDPTNGPVVPGATVTTALLNARDAWAWLEIVDPTQTGNPDVLTLVGAKLAVTCHFVTAAGRVDDRTLYFKIKDR